MKKVLTIILTAIIICSCFVFADKLTNYCGNCGQALDWSDKISLKNY